MEEIIASPSPCQFRNASRTGASVGINQSDMAMSAKNPIDRKIKHSNRLIELTARRQEYFFNAFSFQCSDISEEAMIPALLEPTREIFLILSRSGRWRNNSDRTIETIITCGHPLNVYSFSASAASCWSLASSSASSAFSVFLSVQIFLIHLIPHTNSILNL